MLRIFVARTKLKIRYNDCPYELKESMNELERFYKNGCHISNSEYKVAGLKKQLDRIFSKSKVNSVIVQDDGVVVNLYTCGLVEVDEFGVELTFFITEGYERYVEFSSIAYYKDEISVCTERSEGVNILIRDFKSYIKT